MDGDSDFTKRLESFRGVDPYEGCRWLLSRMSELSRSHDATCRELVGVRKRLDDHIAGAYPGIGPQPGKPAADAGGETWTREVSLAELRKDKAAWQAWADQRERETTWRRLVGEPDNLGVDEFCFREGYRMGAAHLATEQTMHTAWRKRAEEAEMQLESRPPSPPAAADAGQESLAGELAEVLLACVNAVRRHGYIELQIRADRALARYDAPRTDPGAAVLGHDDLCRLSRMFNMHAGRVGDGAGWERRCNEWLKSHIEAAYHRESPAGQPIPEAK